jgi:hypothetical protein
VITVLTYWRALRPGPASATTFMHLLGRDGTVVAGYDGFGAPPVRWHTSDRVVQVHRMPVPGDLAPGVYPIEVGWYEKDTGVRWKVNSRSIGYVVERLLLPLDVMAKEK